MVKEDVGRLRLVIGQSGNQEKGEIMRKVNNRVLVSEDEKGQEVHYTRGDAFHAKKTMCGERLQSISTTYISNPQIKVTCAKCRVIHLAEKIEEE
jgi:hypothetical protein